MSEITNPFAILDTTLTLHTEDDRKFHLFAGTRIYGTKLVELFVSGVTINVPISSSTMSAISTFWVLRTLNPEPNYEEQIPSWATVVAYELFSSNHLLYKKIRDAAEYLGDDYTLYIASLAFCERYRQCLLRGDAWTDECSNTDVKVEVQ